MSWQQLDALTDEDINAEIAKRIGWQKVRKTNAGFTGINPVNNTKENIPPFTLCPEAIKLAENYVAKHVGMAYIIYLGKILATSEKDVSWAQIQKAFAEPKTRAKACLIALRDIDKPAKPLVSVR